MNLSQVFLEGLTALAFISGAYDMPEPVQPSPRPAVQAPTMSIPDMPDPIVVWVEGPAVLSGHYVEDAPNSTRLWVDSIEGSDFYTVVCDKFTAHAVSPAMAVSVLNGPDACRVVEG